MSFTYRGLQAKLERHIVTEQEVQQQIDRILQGNPRIETITDRPAALGDEVILDYAGFCDGEQFAGGTAEQQTLTLGSGMFIPGFEEQLVGANVGEEVTVNVTFPEAYHAPNLAGKAAQFRCKIHGIRVKSPYKADDTFAKEVGGCDTFEQFRQKLADSMQAYTDDRGEMDLQDRLLRQAAETLDFTPNEKLLEHASTCFTVRHPNTLGPQIAKELQKVYGGEVFCVNPPDVDELDDVERICGFHEFFRQSKGHPLNHKENCIRYANSIGKKYEDLNLICCHIGGGVTVAAHRKGKYCSVNDAVNGDGPMAPTRAGWLPATDLVSLCFSGKYTEKEMIGRLFGAGGLVSYLGTSDLREVEKRIREGDKEAEYYYDGMVYTQAKDIGAMSTVACGKVDAIVLTGGMAYSEMLTGWIKEYVSYIAPVVVLAGENEMEALAFGGLRLLSGKEQANVYTLPEGYEV